jgi:predicted GNAT superfamily acetyltransferase
VAAGQIEIRALTALPEFHEAVRLQQEIWGFADIELLPVRLFVVATKVGGQAFGAFDGERMVAFLLAIPGLKPGGATYLHSHMMGVLAGYRDRGLGRALKLRQREAALEAGVQLIEWTFDPLEIKNAFFNIERLGAVVERYVLNQYGTTSSTLHGGLPTDRCVAGWYIASERVGGVIAGGRVAHGEVALRVEVPNDIAEIRASDPRRARDIQASISERFLAATHGGLAVTGFERGDTHSAYLFAPWQSK